MGDGQQLGCMKATVFECDREWFFQMTSPIGSSGHHIIADGIVPFDMDYHNCFTMPLDTGCDFCLNFYDGSFEDGILRVQSQIETKCGNFAPTTYPVGEFTASGPPCGSDDYFYLPCPTTINRDYYATASSHTIEDAFNTMSNYEEMFYEDNSCVFMRNLLNNGEELGPIFCPSLLLNTCTDDSNAIFTSSVGLTFRAPFSMVGMNAPEKICIGMGGDKSMCFAARDFVYEDIFFDEYSTESLSFVASFTIEDNRGTVYFQMTLSDIEYSYPYCGESHLTCFDADVSHIEFTSDWWSELLSQLFSVSSWSANTSFLFPTSLWKTSAQSSRISPTTWGSPISWNSPSSRHSPSSHKSGHSHSSHSNNNVTGIVLGSVSGVCVLIAVVVIFAAVVIHKKRNSNTKQQDDNVYDLMVNDENI